MKHLLSDVNLDALLRPFVGDTALVAFDFDGTLAPLAPSPALAQMRVETRRLLQQIAQAFPCAVISSRAQADLTRALAGAAVWEVVGNYGLEPAESRARWESEVRSWIPRLVARVEQLPGVVLENKGLSVALHYRGVPDPERVRSALCATAEALGDTRVIRGHDVINVLPAGAPGKDTVLRRLIERQASKPVLYVGDDETDEDVFALDLPGFLTVRVGRKDSSRAAYYLNDQPEVDELLLKLLSLKHARTTARVPTRRGRRPDLYEPGISVLLSDAH